MQTLRLLNKIPCLIQRLKKRLVCWAEVRLLAECRFIDSPGRICQVFERSLTVAYALGESAFQDRAFAFKSLFRWLLDYHVGTLRENRSNTLKNGQRPQP